MCRRIVADKHGSRETALASQVGGTGCLDEDSDGEDRSDLGAIWRQDRQDLLMDWMRRMRGKR